jgi:membrane fusion protein
VLLARSPSITVLTVSAVVIALTIISFGWWGEYTRKEHVVGYLSPTQGLIKVFTPQAGTVIDKRVAEGQTVQAGEVLMIISSERSTATTENAHAVMLSALHARHDSLKQEKEV